MYSPKIKPQFIPALYRLAKDRKKPMTVIVNEMIAASLKKHESEGNNNATQSQSDIAPPSGDCNEKQKEVYPVRR